MDVDACGAEGAGAGAGAGGGLASRVAVTEVGKAASSAWR